MTRNFGLLHGSEATIMTPNMETMGIKSVGMVTIQRALQPRITKPGVARVVFALVPTKTERVSVRAVDVPLGMNADVGENNEMHTRRMGYGEPMALNVVTPAVSKRWGQVELINVQFNGRALEWQVDSVNEEEDTWMVFQCMTTTNATVLC